MQYGSRHFRNPLPNRLHSAREPEVVLVQDADVVGTRHFNAEIGFSLPGANVRSADQSKRQSIRISFDDRKRRVRRTAVDDDEIKIVRWLGGNGIKRRFDPFRSVMDRHDD
jgi:hypothetical protein